MQRKPKHTPKPKAPGPGIYLVRVERCKAEMDNFEGWSVTFEFSIRSPIVSVQPLTLTISMVDGEDRGNYLCRVFAVAGVTVLDPSDLSIACREIAGRYLFVEFYPDAPEQLHVMQLATTTQVAAPDHAWPEFPSEDPYPTLSHEDQRDMSDPELPRFHSCSAEQKGDLRLHPLEQSRALRAAAAK